MKRVILFVRCAYSIPYESHFWIFTITWLVLAAYVITILFEDSFTSRYIISAYENLKHFVFQTMSKLQHAMDFQTRKCRNATASPRDVLHADEMEVAMYLLN